MKFAPTPTLVRQLLLTQLGYAVVVGAIALGCVWWVAQSVVRDNLEDWAERWLVEVNALGTGLYLQERDERFLEIESYLVRFPEIRYVRFYDTGGELLFAEYGAEQWREYPLLDVEGLDRLAAGAGPRHYELDTTKQPFVRISQPVITEQMTDIDLLNSQDLSEARTVTSVVGFVEVGLDYSRYDRNLLANLGLAVLYVVVAMLLLIWLGRLALIKAMVPLQAMQQPLERVADGELDVDVPSSPYREITVVARALETAIGRIRERDRHLRRLANYDPLTGLPNRNCFAERFSEFLSLPRTQRHSGALLFIDLDQFKHINDSYSHQAGDAVLAQVAGRLRQIVRKEDLVARYSGDEFVIFVTDVTMERADGIAQKLIRDLREFPVIFEQNSFIVGCSIGITRVAPSESLGVDELVSQADVACRRAKSLGRNRTSHYAPEAAELESIRTDLEWHQRLKQALDQDEFVLHYQPIMRVEDRSMEHYEALLRLQGKEELHLPDAFLPAAERFGLMQEIDLWVIAAALAQLAEVRRIRPKVRFSINVSGGSFADGRLAAYILEHLLLNGLPGEAVILEVTEQVAVGSFAQAVPQIQDLLRTGCEIAVDDFGTGYSSLSYLKRLPVQFIKVDGAFIRKLVSSRADQTIVRAVADIARIMGKKTIAEFVGDEKTMSLIRELGIDYAQGYFVGEPKAADEYFAARGEVIQMRAGGRGA